MSSFFRTLRSDFKKHLASMNEEIDLKAELGTGLDFKVIPSPFPHLVVDNFFSEERYAALSRYFTAILNRGFSETANSSRFQPFLEHKGEFAYDGYMYTPQFEDIEKLKVFFSNTWNLFFSSLFNRPTTQNTSVAFHHHPAGDKNGYAHNDYSSYFFSSQDRLSNGIIYRTRNLKKQTDFMRERRAITLIYFLGNDPWENGDGGETALFSSKNGPPIKLVAPKNNRLLAFEVSPMSYHAFQNNQRPRSSITQWFHVDEMWMKNKYGFL